MNKLPIIGAVLLVIGGLIYSSMFVVSEREQAIIARFGEIKRTIDEPGLYFKAPFSFVGLDTIQYVDDRLLRYDLNDLRIQVRGGKFYDVDAFITYRIENLRLFRSVAGGNLLNVEERLRTRLDSALRNTYGLRGFEAALSEERAAMMLEVRDQLRPQAQTLGVTLEDVRIRRTDLTAEVSQQTYERMKAERLAVAEQLRARGREAAQRITAIADRRSVEITAEAGREAEVVRGEGDAERNRIFAEAFTKDEEFFQFYRSMLAYEEALQDSGTTMVLSPDSEFFQYFSGGQTPKSAAPAVQ